MLSVFDVCLLHFACLLKVSVSTVRTTASERVRAATVATNRPNPSSRSSHSLRYQYQGLTPIDKGAPADKAQRLIGDTSLSPDFIKAKAKASKQADYPNLIYPTLPYP